MMFQILWTGALQQNEDAEYQCQIWGSRHHHFLALSKKRKIGHFQFLIFCLLCGRTTRLVLEENGVFGGLGEIVENISELDEEGSKWASCASNSMHKKGGILGNFRESWIFSCASNSMHKRKGAKDEFIAYYYLTYDYTMLWLTSLVVLSPSFDNASCAPLPWFSDRLAMSDASKLVMTGILIMSETSSYVGVMYNLVCCFQLFPTQKIMPSQKQRRFASQW
jgi:hypothetical protein